VGTVERNLSTTTLEVVFEGEAVRSGAVDARILAASLVGYTDVFTRANTIANGEASAAAVMVESNFKNGSFVFQLRLAQSLLEGAQNLITHHEFLSASALAAALGFIAHNKDSLIELWKWLRGKKPDKAVPIGNQTEV
jgi:hypothetical protein